MFWLLCRTIRENRRLRAYNHEMARTLIEVTEALTVSTVLQRQLTEELEKSTFTILEMSLRDGV